MVLAPVMSKITHMLLDDGWSYVLHMQVSNTQIWSLDWHWTVCFGTIILIHVVLLALAVFTLPVANVSDSELICYANSKLKK